MLLSYVAYVHINYMLINCQLNLKTFWEKCNNYVKDHLIQSYYSVNINGN